MSRIRLWGWGVGAALAFLCADAAAECPVVDFENLATGTAVTTQYDGVTMEVVPQSCDNDPKLYMRIVVPAGGASSGTKAIQIDGGCPDFSDDYLKMTFDDLQNEVTFNLGEATGDAGWNFDVRYYSDGGLLGTIHAESAEGVHRFIRVGSASGSKNIRRIEVEETIGGFEVIDDLYFNVDTTAPVARIESPTFEGCACGTIILSGEACDPDGDYGEDRLEYLRTDAAPGTGWTLVGSATVPQCGSGYLYSWNTTGIAHGEYYLRLTVTNACGMTATAVTVVCVDKQFDTLEMRYPASNGIVGGDVCIDGTVWDHMCFEDYAVEYRPSGVGVWNPVDPVNPTYDETVVNDPFAHWNTTAMGVVDGLYEVRVTANDVCGNTSTLTRKVTVDNTPPLALIASPLPCKEVTGTPKIIGTATDANLAAWVLDYTGGDTHDWQEISSGTSPIIASVLGIWDVSGLDKCAYTLRLRVWDKSDLDCNMASEHMSEYTLSVPVGTCLDMDSDGDGDIDLIDFAAFQEEFTGPLP